MQEIRLTNPGRYAHPVTSMCPRCLQSIRGEVVATRDGVVMKKECPQHGPFECVVSSDVAAYERMRRSPRIVKLPAQPAMPEAKGCPDDCGLCSAHDQHTCLAIVEITSRCNLPCPVCLAGATAQGADLSVARVVSALEKLREAEGAVTPLQFAGGEPTLHPELIEIVREARRLGYRKLEIDSNGLLLASRPDLAEDLRQAGLAGVYLQMDTVEAKASSYIRGRDLLSHKLRAIDNCKRAGLQVVLSVTVVPGVNDARLWDMIRFAA
ncbi:MAG: radical SAM protein, partial [Betaproteobacteria bacterium]|nr:radical SAM protein [Betaproteobacteria bacterium]